MATIGKVRAVFTASASGLQSGVNAASGSMKKLERDVSGLRGSVSTLKSIAITQFFASMASSALSAGQALVGMGQRQAEVIDGTSKMAARLGMTYGELAGLSHAADLAGVSMETIGKAATKADIMFVKAAQGSSVAQAAFAKVGLSVDQLQGMSASDRFQAITDAIAALPTEAERAAASVAIFGKSGAELLPLFAGGAGAIQEATAEAERLGLALTNAQGRDVEAMNDAFTKAQAAINGVVNQVVAYLSPAIKNVADTFTNLIGSVGGANIGQTIGDALLQGARFLAQIGDYLITNLSGVWEYASKIGAQWSAVWDFGNRVAQFFMGIGNTLKIAFGLIILGITGPVQALMEAAQYIGDRLGLDTSGLDSAVAGMDAFNHSIAGSMNEAAAAAAQNFDQAFGSGPANSVGLAIAGPLTTTLDAAIAQAEASAAQIDEATKQTVATAKEELATAGAASREGVKGIDSRSKEGISEMFRIMRGGGEGTQERIAKGIERIAENTDDMGDSEDVADIP
jgi:hypothetical protein